MPTTILDVIERTAQISDQVPGYYLLLHLGSQVTGTSPFAGRYLSFLIGLLSIAVVYQLG